MDAKREPVAVNLRCVVLDACQAWLFEAASKAERFCMTSWLFGWSRTGASLL